MKPPFVRNPYNYDMNAASDESAMKCTGPSLTQAQFQEECDINTIVRRFGLTGELPDNGRAPAYGDFDGVSDYRTALHMVQSADEAFMALPGHVRARFENDPQQLLEFFSNPANLAEAKTLGLTRTLTQPDPKPAETKPEQSST